MSKNKLHLPIQTSEKSRIHTAALSGPCPLSELVVSHAILILATPQGVPLDTQKWLYCTTQSVLRAMIDGFFSGNSSLAKIVCAAPPTWHAQCSMRCQILFVFSFPILPSIDWSNYSLKLWVETINLLMAAKKNCFSCYLVVFVSVQQRYKPVGKFWWWGSARELKDIYIMWGEKARISHWEGNSQPHMLQKSYQLYFQMFEINQGRASKGFVFWGLLVRLFDLCLAAAAKNFFISLAYYLVVVKISIAEMWPLNNFGGSVGG